MSKTKTGAKQFFFAQAAHSYPVGANAAQQLKAKHECSRRLAIAEYWAWDNGYTFMWDRSDVTSEEHDCSEAPFYPLWDCCMYSAEPERSKRGTPIPVQVLGGVDFGRDVDPWGQDYKRVVEAELALEQMPEEVTV